MDRPWGVLEASRGGFGGSWRPCGGRSWGLGGSLAWPWGLWEASWDGPAGFWRSPGAVLGGLRRFLGVLEATWGWFDGVLEASWGSVGRSQRLLEAVPMAVLLSVAKY